MEIISAIRYPVNVTKDDHRILTECVNVLEATCNEMRRLNLSVLYTVDGDCIDRDDLTQLIEMLYRLHDIESVE